MPEHRLRGWMVPAALTVLVLAVYLLTGSSDLKHNGDTDLRYQTTQAIVDQHHIWVANPLWRDSRMSVGNGGHLYAFYAPGQSALMIPLYIAGKAIAHHLSLPYDTTTLYAVRSLDLFLGPLVALLFFFLAVTLGFTRTTSALLTLIYAFGSAAWPDAQSALEQTQVTLFILAGVLGAVRYASSGESAPWWVLLSGMSVGAAIFTRYDAFILVPAFLAYFIWIGMRRRNNVVRNLTIFAAGLVPFVVGVAAWNVARFGSPVLTGLHESTFGGNPVEGFLGLTVSPGKGLLWYVPVLLALPFCARAFQRRMGARIILPAGLVVLTLGFYSNVLYWHGDPAWGPRYLYSVMPLLILPLGEIVERRRSRPKVACVLLVLVLLSAGLQVAAVSVTQWRFWYRLQAMQQKTVHEATWAGQPFRWGAAHYHYYWNVRQSPVLLQLDDLYQVARLSLGNTAYRFTAPPDPFVASNTASNYPINSFAFWWLDPIHPVLGTRARAGLAITLSMTALAALLMTVCGLRRGGAGRRTGLALDVAQPRGTAV